MNDVILKDAFDVARRHLADAVQPVHRHEIVIASCTEPVASCQDARLV